MYVNWWMLEFTNGLASFSVCAQHILRSSIARRRLWIPCALIPMYWNQTNTQTLRILIDIIISERVTCYVFVCVCLFVHHISARSARRSACGLCYVCVCGLAPNPMWVARMYVVRSRCTFCSFLGLFSHTHTNIQRINVFCSHLSRIYAIIMAIIIIADIRRRYHPHKVYNIVSHMPCAA